MAWFLLSWPYLVYYFGMDLSEFDGLEPVSEHELKTLIQHLPDGALGLFERRLILRVLELERNVRFAIEDLEAGEYENPEDNLRSLVDADAIQLDGFTVVADNLGPVDTSGLLGEEVEVTINFGDYDLDFSMTIEEWTRAMNEHLNRGHY